MNIYYKDYTNAEKFATSIILIDQQLLMYHDSFNTEIGQCPCICIEDESGYIVNRLFYDQHLYDMQPNFVRG